MFLLECPNCQKQYSLRPENLLQDRLEFQCSQCKQDFYCEPDQWEIPQKKLKAFIPEKKEAQDLCSSCGAVKRPEFSECPSCGALYDKMIDRQQISESQLPVDLVLKQEWRKVLDHYDSVQEHESFIQKALARKNLAFASQMYRNMLEANPQDARAKAMQEKIIKVATVAFGPIKRDFDTPKPKKFTWILLFVGLVFAVMGLTLKQPAMIAPAVVFWFLAYYLKKK